MNGQNHLDRFRAHRVVEQVVDRRLAFQLLGRGVHGTNLGGIVQQSRVTRRSRAGTNQAGLRESHLSRRRLDNQDSLLAVDGRSAVRGSCGAGLRSGGRHSRNSPDGCGRGRYRGRSAVSGVLAVLGGGGVRPDTVARLPRLAGLGRPTVVMVVRAHQSASSKVVKLEPGAFSSTPSTARAPA